MPVCLPDTLVCVMSLHYSFTIDSPTIQASNTTHLGDILTESYSLTVVLRMHTGRVGNIRKIFHRYNTKNRCKIRQETCM